ncbi:MAG TPA: glycosyl hydrolase [Terriglobales bacterium]|nr:glycosyl hydrolase [Terriglobales bacterium]
MEHEFRNPPDAARIMVRWWWFGPAVDKQELEREMLRVKEGGIGGFEVQPVYPLALDDPKHGFHNHSYLSDEFLDALRFASEKAKQLGLRMDLTLGSGWPYGGPGVPITEAASSLRIVRTKTDGHSPSIPVPSLTAGETLIAAFLTTADNGRSEHQYRQISDVHDGFVTLPQRSSAGEVLFFISSRTGMQVKRAAVGAEGFVVDHYDRSAVEHYLQHVGDRLMQAFPSDRPYSVFCDSLEVYGSDWSPDFLEEFHKRRGYDLVPHLPELAEGSDVKSRAVRRDWGKTLTELFDERFASTVHDWAQKNHTKFRMQAYGIPPAELSSSSLADLPEGEGAQWKSLSATRWASSASHIYGVPVTSSETWTWLHSPVFRATPLDMKAEADRHFLEGINQFVGHGWPYTPEGVEYPGWRFYAAAVFDEKNPWWIVMPDVTAYLQRVSYLLRQGEPVNDVAVYLPNDDAWASFRPGRVNLFQTLQSRIGTNVVESTLSSGHDFDFFDEDALQRKGRIEGNTLALGTNRYRVVILPNVETISPDTYRTFEDFARAGGILVATRQLPSAAPGLLAGDSQNVEVRDISRRLFQAGNAQGHFLPDEQKLSALLTQLTEADVSFTPAEPDIGFVHRRTRDADIYFVANTTNQSQKTEASFRVAATTVQLWDPMNGTVSNLNVPDPRANSATIKLDLEPYGSRVFVLSRSSSLHRTRKAAPVETTAIDISHDWHVTFGTSGKTETMQDLKSWTDYPETRYFSGTATYEKTITVPASALRDSKVQLDFGEGKPLPEEKLRAGMQAWLDGPIREVAVVYVNSKRTGSVWCPPYSLDVTSFLHEGENTIRVEVENLALNYMAGHALPDYRLLNLRYGVRFEAQDMDQVQPIPAGLFGPIRLLVAPSNKSEL